MSTVALRAEERAETPKDLKPSDRPRITYTQLEGEVAQKLDDLFGVKDCLMEVNPGRVLLPHDYRRIGELILDMEIRKDDVVLVSYPRTGSTWAQEMVWLIGNDLDFQRAKTVPQLLRCPLLEEHTGHCATILKTMRKQLTSWFMRRYPHKQGARLSAVLSHEPGEWKEDLNSVESVQLLPSPRYLKTHLPWELLPTQLSTVRPKIIYVTRNPKDMCVSFYHYCMLIHNLKGSFEDFCELFLRDRVPMGPIWNHILGFWSRRHEPNILFLTYEEMKRDLAGVIRTTADFLGKTLSDNDVRRLEEHLSFGSMKKNPAVNLEPILEKKNGPLFLRESGMHFIRKGEVGDWKNHMSSDLAARFDSWTEENLRGTGLHF